LCIYKIQNIIFRYNNILDIPQVRTSRYGKKTFKFAAATLWNSLPDHFRTENSFSNPHTQSEELFLALFLSFWNFSPYKNARPKGKS
jgi:hypothetical protein